MKKQATRAVVFMQRDDLATPQGPKKKKHLHRQVLFRRIWRI
jgi:hypothetical protein